MFLHTQKHTQDFWLLMAPYGSLPSVRVLGRSASGSRSDLFVTPVSDVRPALVPPYPNGPIEQLSLALASISVSHRRSSFLDIVSNAGQEPLHLCSARHWVATLRMLCVSCDPSGIQIAEQPDPTVPPPPVLQNGSLRPTCTGMRSNVQR